MARTHAMYTVPASLSVLLIGLQILSYYDAHAAFKTRIGDVASVRPCVLPRDSADPEWCNTPLSLLIDSLKSDSSPRGGGSLPDGAVCVYLHERGRRSCRKCHAGRWSRTPCNPNERAKRQVPTPGDIAPYLLYISCKLFCNQGGGGGGAENSENGVSSIYQLPAIHCPSVPSPIVAPPGANSTVVQWPMPEAHAQDGSLIFPMQVAGKGGSGDAFPEGRHMITYAAFDFSGFADTCSFMVEVKVVRCRTPEWPKNGNRSCEFGEMIYGTSCTFTCDPGYALEGKSRITCMYDGTYDFPTPKCKANTCGALMLPKHGVIYKCTKHNFYDSVCILVCNSARGYKASSPVSITTCLNNGLWSRPIPSCVDVMPPKFENCPETNIVIQAEKGTRTATVTWPDMIVRDNSEYASVKQTKGQASGSRFNEGLNEIQYTAIDPNGNEAHPCTFSIVVEVPKCSVPSFGDRYLEAHCPNGYEYGASCELSCRMGVPLEGATSITCEIDNGIAPTAFWDWGQGQTTPSCKERICDDLIKPKHGAMACDKWAGGTLCQMQCNANYDVPRTVAISQHFVCASSTGKWKPTEKVPDCTELRRPSTMVLPSELYYYAGDCGTSQTTELIKTQFIMSLQSSASWKDACSKDRNCKAENVDVMCGPIARRRRQAISSRRSKRSESLAALVTWDFSVIFDMENLTVTDAINKHKDILKNMAANTKIDIQKGVFNLNVTGFQLGEDSFAAGWTNFECAKGQVSVYASASCAACPTGTYFNDEDCAPCPLGTYQDKDGAFECKKCPNGTRSLTNGAREESECKALCKPGTFSPTSSVPCSPCPHGFYQGSTGATACVPCPVGTTTELTQSTNDSVCIPYDVMVVGPASFTMRKWLTDDLGDFTLTTWIKTNTQGAESTAISLVHPQRGHLISLDLSATSGLQAGHGNISSNVRFPLETWTHVALVWDEWRKELTIYVGGDSVLTQTFPQVGSPLVTAGATISISTGSQSVVHLQGLMLLSSRRDAALVKAMSGTCTLTHEVALLSLDDIPKARDSSVLVITPSTCDAIDECHPDPCYGHTCVNGRDVYHCICQDGYTGENCTEPPDFCADNICHEGSTCLNDRSDYTCACPPNFTDRYCQTEMVDVDGVWNLWTEWSTCSATCGGGWTVRMRECNNPPPEYNGAPCNGSNVEKLECNTEACPVCAVSDLERAYGARPRCTGDEHSLTCTVSCREGLMFVENPPIYRCTDGFWTPSKQIIPCTRIDNPERLELRFKGTYEKTGCVDKAVANLMSQQLIAKTDQVSCVARNACNMTAKVDPCPPATRHKRAARDQKIRLSVVLAVNMRGGELDLSGYHNNYRASPQLTSVTGAVEALEKSAEELKSSGFQAFSVEGPKGSYNVNPHDMTITPKVTCSDGFITRDAFCVGCPMGTRFTSGRCVLCDLGTYQNEAGQQSCLRCPSGYTTHYRGSTHRHQCIRSEKEEEIGLVTTPAIVDLDSENDLPTQQTRPLEDDNRELTQFGVNNGNSRQKTPTLAETEESVVPLPPILTQTDSRAVHIPSTLPETIDSSVLQLPKKTKSEMNRMPSTRANDEDNRNTRPLNKERVTQPKQQLPAEEDDPQFNDIALKADAPPHTAETGDVVKLAGDDVTTTGSDNSVGTIVIATVVTVCVIALIIVVIFNFMLINKRLKRDESSEPPSWVRPFLHGGHLKGGGEKTGGRIALGSPSNTTSA